jgi:hypothetical protein
VFSGEGAGMNLPDDALKVLPPEVRRDWLQVPEIFVVYCTDAWCRHSEVIISSRPSGYCRQCGSPRVVEKYADLLNRIRELQGGQ